MSWMSTVPLLAAAATLMMLPGGLVAWSWGTRGLLLWGVAPALSVGLAAAGAIVTQAVQLRWSVVTYLAVTVSVLIVTAIVQVARRLVRRPSTSGATATAGPRYHWASFLTVAIALGVPLLILGIRFAQIFGHPDSISQTYDNVFHQNALRFIEDTGRGSSLTLGNLDPASNAISFYPAAWHDIIAVLNSALPIDGLVATNLGNIVIGAVMWPSGCVLLVRTLFGFRPFLLISAGVLSAGFGIFPYLLVDFGVLYPNFLGLVLLPAVLAVTAHLMRLSTNLARRRTRDLLLFAGGFVALLLSHPSVALTFLALAFVFVLVGSLRSGRRLRGRSRWLRLAVGVVPPLIYAVVLVNLWGSVRPSQSASLWPPLGSVGQAWGEAITSSPLGRPVPLLIAVLTVLGVVAVIRWRSIPGYCLVAAAVLNAWFYVVSAGFAQDDVRDAVTRIWYNDSYRTAAQLVVTTLPIAACGAAWVAELATSRLTRRSWRHRSAVVAGLLGVTVGVVALVAGTSDDSVLQEQDHAGNMYKLTDASPLLTPDERAVLERLPSHVPADAVIAGIPGNGSALAYAIADRRTLLTTAADTPQGVETILYTRLNALTTDPAVCAAARRLNVSYILDFGWQEVNMMTHNYPGLLRMESNPGLRLVDSQGKARLFQLSACS